MATVHLSPVGNGFQFLSANVIPALALGKIYTYGAGTTTAQDTYTTLTGNVKNANPIILNSDGRCPQEVWLVEGFSYRFDLKDSLGNLIQTLDNLYGINDLSVNAGPLPSSSVTFQQAGSGAIVRTMQNKARESISVFDYMSAAQVADVQAGSLSLDVATAIQTALNDAAAFGGATVFFPYGKYRIGTTLSWPAGVRLLGDGVNNRWFNGITPCVIYPFGATNGITITPGAATAVGGFSADNIAIVGTNATGTSKGLYLNASAGGSSISAVRFNGTITDFPGYCAHHNGTVYDVVYDRANMNNATAGAESLVKIENGVPSQLTFDDCYLVQYTNAKWCVDHTGNNLRFVNGTVAAGSANANGIKAGGGLSIFGTHVEGPGTGTTGIGIQYLGAFGGLIAPSVCAGYGIGVRIGDGTASEASAYVLCGGITGFSAGGTGDVVITAGGVRSGLIAQLSRAGGIDPTVVNLRLSVDGEAEPSRLDGTFSQFKHFSLDETRTATVGAVTINKASGRINIAAGQTAVMVTNSLVAASSKVFACCSTVDATAYVKAVVPTAGSFTITLGAAATGQTAIDFLVVQIPT